MKNLFTRLLLMSLMIIGLVTTSYSAHFYKGDNPTEQSALMAGVATAELHVHFETINRFTMAEYPYGIKKVEVGDFNPTTGLGENYEDIGKILRDSITTNVTAPTKTKILEELTNTPVHVIENNDGEETYSLSLLDASAANLAKYLGGTTTGVAPDPLSWNKPLVNPTIIHSFKFTLKTDTVIEIRKGLVTGVRQWDGRAGAFVIALTIEPLDTGVADVLPVKITDYTAQV
ncbi:hypothetical protein [Roseivirga sp. UBA838]|uniref:hypothetical protein n=1 Tax=Roseivirga sp. UBA838 TaxID=1947393 RepID=UPI00257D7DBF|nr:hypothetical protein [Roseivirga sp. UBA838]|tara:strand:+ start:20728 stop:21420 length:693 start_codon:yes stop_codon:yes gene_type:complete